MKVLVTGASGFVGSHLVEALVSEQHEVTCLVRNPAQFRIQHPSIRLVKGDLLLPQSLQAAVASQDVVYHLAGVVVAPNQAIFNRHNVFGTENLIQAILTHQPSCKKFAYVSSLAAAGPSLMAREEDVSRPISDYGMSKKLAEDRVRAHAHELSSIILRPPMVYGPWDKQFLILMKMIQKGVSTVVSGEERFYSTVYVKDLVRALILASSSNQPSGSHFYVTDPAVHTWTDILNKMEQALGKKSLHLRIPPMGMKFAAIFHDVVGRLLGKTFPYNQDKYKEAVAPAWVCSPEKAKVDLDFSTHYDLVKGMEETVAWYRYQGWIA